MQRRRFLTSALFGASGFCFGCGQSAPRPARRRRVVVLAFDGMEPKLLRKLNQSGRTPNLARLAQRGTFTTVGTSDPPQTPVAFSNIISGNDARVHNVFDFIHRDPNPTGPLGVRPYFSTSSAEPSSRVRGISLGKWRLPLEGGAEPRLLRRGPAYWQPLVRAGKAASVFFLPSNYPPQIASGPGTLETMSGMGTPDVLGGLGQFTLFSPDAPLRGRKVNGGRFVYANLGGNSHRAELEIEGPENFLIDPDRQEGRVPRMKIKFSVVRDPERELVKIQLGPHRVLLKRGEWSAWIPVDFPTNIPAAAALEALQAQVDLPGMIRFYVKNVHPKCEIYASPVNVDPVRPVNQISWPADLSARVARRHGRYYTLGIPEDYNALQNGALDEDQFLSQAYLAHNERVAHYQQALKEFQHGCLFYYFGTTDLVSHMFWRDRDPQHPGRRPEQGDRYARVIEDLYHHVDGLVGETMDQLHEDDTLVVLSDHGFTSFRRSVNLNRLLLEWGYLALKPKVRPGDVDFFLGVDWSRTRAYAMGLNSIFVNLRGREKNGTVAPGAPQRQVMDEVGQKLMDLTDDELGGARPIHSVIDVRERFPGVDPKIAPDLILGYNHNYRVGWKAPLGGIAAAPFADNLKRWSGDHCVASQLVSGVLLCSRPLDQTKAALIDIGPTLLALSGIGVPENMLGRSLVAAGGSG